MTVYAVVKCFDTLAEADRFAESVTEDDIVAVYPIEDDLLEKEPAAAYPLSLVGSSSRGPRTAPGSGRLSPAESERPAHNVIPFPGWSVKV